MRHLIAQQQAELSSQKQFFERWIHPTFESLCSAIDASGLGPFYRSVARLAKSFFSLEQSSFEML